MTYFPDLHTYLHQSALLLQAYPQTTRITTKYSQPRKTKPGKVSASENEAKNDASSRPKREPSATLTLKTYHPESGICLKYKTDKAAEVGRLMTGLGRLAKGEMIELPSGPDNENNTGVGLVIGSGTNTSGAGPTQGEKMDVDVPVPVEAKTATQMTQGQQQPGGSAKKKKKSKK